MSVLVGANPPDALYERIARQLVTNASRGGSFLPGFEAEQLVRQVVANLRINGYRLAYSEPTGWAEISAPRPYLPPTT